MFSYMYLYAVFLPVDEALTETGSTRSRRPPLWHLVFIEVLQALWLILEQITQTPKLISYATTTHTYTFNLP